MALVSTGIVVIVSASTRLASCASQEHTSRPENLTLAVRRFALPNMVAFMALAREFPAALF